MIDFKDITYEKFKMQILRYIFEHPYWPFEDVSKKNVGAIPEFAKCNIVQLPKLFEFIKKFIDEFGDDMEGKKGRYGTIFGGLAILARAGIKSMIESKTCDDNTVFPSNILITTLKLKNTSGLTLCSQQDLQVIARHTEIDESEYIENSDILSPYFKLLNKKSNLKTDTIELLHEISGVQTTVNVTKSMRIQNNKGCFCLYGKSYNLKDIESCPTSFDWNVFIKDENGEYNVSEPFKEMAKRISLSDAVALCKYSYIYNKEYNHIFPQLKNSLISELNESQIVSGSLVPPMGKILENEFINNSIYSYKLIHMLSMLLDDICDEEYIRKLILLLIYCISRSSAYNSRQKIYIRDNKIISNVWSKPRDSIEFDNDCATRYLESLYNKVHIIKYSPETIASTLKDIINSYKSGDCSYIMLWIVASLKLSLEK